MKHTLKALTFLAALFALNLPAHAETFSDTVVAVVNEEVITEMDVEARFTFSVRQMKSTPPEDAKQRLRQRVLKELIDEKIQQQYAASKGWDVSEQELKEAIESIEERNSLPKGSFYKVAKGVEESARAKIRTELLWQKVLKREIQPDVYISNNEIDHLLKNIMQGKSKTEKEVFQIFLPLDPENEALIKKIHEKITKESNPFHKLVEEFSEGPAAREGGRLGYFAEGELSQALDEAVSKLDKGEISTPIRSPNGWHILQVGDVRTLNRFSTKPIRQYRLLSLHTLLSGEKGERKKQEEMFKDFLDEVESAQTMEKAIIAAKKDLAYSFSRDMGWTDEADLPKEILDLVQNTKTKNLTDTLKKEHSLQSLWLEGTRYQLPENLQAYRDRVRERLFKGKMEQAERRFLRDLKREAYIDIRL